MDEDGYDVELIEELFLNAKRKPVRISKEKMISGVGGVAASNVNQFSRIETDEDENSDSSIQENVTYQAL